MGLPSGASAFDGDGLQRGGSKALLSGREKIEEVLLRTDLVELVRRHVELRRVGRSYVGLCPFHAERTPSFHVFPESRRFRCFGCDRGGDAITFVMEMEGKDFPTALRQLADQAGVVLEYDAEARRRIARRRALLRACEVAARHFADNLWSPAGETARAHLASRGVSEEMARRVGLGYALPAWQDLTDRLAREGIDPRDAVEAGLIVSRDGGRPGHYDVFRGRLMVPIRDADGRVIAFGGRILQGDDPRKYVNSRETPLYRKSETLYGLDVARPALRARAEAVLVEGYFDAIALWQAGVDNAVALCSTALTAAHLSRLQRLGVESLVLLLDGDEAGQRAALRLAGPILATGLAARVITLPDGHDPDTFVREHGVAAYRELEAKAPSLSAHVLSRLLPRDGGYEARMRALAQLRPIVGALPEGVQRRLFLAEVARTFDLPQREVDAYFGAGRAPAREGEPRPVARATPSRRPPPPRREVEIVAYLFAFPQLRPVLGEKAAALLGDVDLKEAVVHLLSEGADAEEIFSSLPEVARRALGERIRRLGQRADVDWEKEARDGLLHLEIEKLREDLRSAIGAREELERDLFAPGDPREKEAILQAIRAFGEHVERLRERMGWLMQQLRGAA